MTTADSRDVLNSARFNKNKEFDDRPFNNASEKHVRRSFKLDSELVSQGKEFQTIQYESPYFDEKLRPHKIMKIKVKNSPDMLKMGASPLQPCYSSLGPNRKNQDQASNHSLEQERILSQKILNFYRSSKEVSVSHGSDDFQAKKTNIYRKKCKTSKKSLRPTFEVKVFEKSPYLNKHRRSRRKGPKGKELLYCSYHRSLSNKKPSSHKAMSLRGSNITLRLNSSKQSPLNNFKAMGSRLQANNIKSMKFKSKRTLQEEFEKMESLRPELAKK